MARRNIAQDPITFFCDNERLPGEQILLGPLRFS